MKAMLIDENKNFVWSDVAEPVVGAHDVCIEIHAAALNRADLLQRQGKYPSPKGCPPWMGLEVAGVVRETGAAVTKWRKGDRVCALLDGGKDVAFLTLGDPTVYSTYLYLHRKVTARGYEAEIIPGVPSFCAVAARLGAALCEKSERLLIVPASHKDVDDCLDVDANLVFMKAGREIGALKEKLAEKGLLERASMVANCGMEGEAVYPRFAELIDGSGYFSVVLVKKGEEA